jgi:hypothetical protein
MSMYKFLNREEEPATDWIRTAIDRHSLPLLHRIRVVLGSLESSANKTLAEWATTMNRDLVEPALSGFPDSTC